jgi:predicted nucleic acid-binding protein
MMKKLFIDSDVVLDLLLARPPHDKPAQLLFSLIEQGACKGVTTALVMANVHYLLRREISSRQALEALKKLNLLLDIIELDARAVDRALASFFKDFEDGLQYFAAFANHVDFIITRNTRDFGKSVIPVCTPSEFLAQYAQGAK